MEHSEPRVRLLSDVSSELLREATNDFAALVRERLPRAFAPPEPSWPLIAAAFLGRISTILESVTILVEQGQRADAMVMVRVLYDHAATFCWLGISPEAHVDEWRRWDDWRLKTLYNDAASFGVEVLTPDELAGLGDPPKPRGLAELADAIDKHWPQQFLARSEEIVMRAARWHEANRAQIEAIERAVAKPIRLGAAFVKAHGDQIQAVVEALDQFDRRATEIEAEWGDAGLGYLVGPLDMAEQLVLSLYASPGDAEELFDFLETALADPDFVRRTCEALDDAVILSDQSRDHLKHGLNHLGNREPLHAWPPLIIGLEGAFVDVALDQGIAVRDGNHVYLADDQGKAASKLPSVEGVAKELGHAHDQTEFGEFLIRQVYGGDGNPFRHGTAVEGVRERAICLAIAVVGWLDAFVTPGSRDLFRDAVAEELIRRDETDEPGTDPLLGHDAGRTSR